MLQKPLFDSNGPTLNRGYSGMPDVDFAEVLTETDLFRFSFRSLSGLYHV